MSFLSFLLPFLISCFPLILEAVPCEVGVCGDGVLNPGEECDDGNLIPGDGCDAVCQESFDLVVQPPLFSYPDGYPRDLTAADLNNDGLQDLLVTTFRNAYLYSYLMQPDGTLIQVGKYSLGSNTAMLDVGQLNGDHSLDVVTADADTDQLFIFFGNGDGTLTLANIFLPGDRPRSVKIGDINTDGYGDLIVGLNWSKGFRIYYGDGAGGFPRSDFLATDEGAIDSVIADFNGDGYNDLVLCTVASAGITPSLRIYLGGASGLTLGQDFRIGMATAHAMDLNQDGYPDLVGYGVPTNAPQGTGGYSLFSFLNQGDGTFILAHELNTTKAGWMSKVGDFNNDQIPDLAIVSRSPYREVRVFLGDGQGWFQPERTYPMPDQTDGVGIVDLNLDGTPDLVVAPLYNSAHREVIPVYNHNYYQFPRCGDGRIGRGETCDDGNQSDGDGCAATCQLEISDDTDHDGLSDVEENVLFATNPLDPDTDHDCVMDGAEVCSGADPLDPSDQEGCQVVVAPEGEWRIQVTLLEASAGLSSDIYLAQPVQELLIKNSLKHVGKVATTEVYSGETVVFFIRVHGERMGLGTYDHYSDSIFGRVNRLDAYRYTVNFEDLPVEQADWDFNDVVLLVEFLPVTPAVGVHRNTLDEYQSTLLAGPPIQTHVTLDFDGNASLILPAGSLDSDAGLILIAGLPELYTELDNETFASAGVYKKVTLTNGQATLAGGTPATLSIGYPDEDDDGLVDGTSLDETIVAMARFDEDTASWVPLSSVVDPTLNTVTATTDQFSLFSIGLVTSPESPPDNPSPPLDPPPQGPMLHSQDNSSGGGCLAIPAGQPFAWTPVFLVLLLGGGFHLRKVLKP